MKNINGENYQLTKVSSKYTGWETIGVFPESEGLSVIKYIRYLLKRANIKRCAMLH